MSMRKKVALGGIVVAIASMWIGLLVAIDLGYIGGEAAPPESSATVGFKEVPFGPFLIVAPDKATAASGPATATTVVDDEPVLTASPYYIELPATYTRTGITGKAAGGDVVEVATEWKSSSGAVVHATMTRVDPSALPIEIADAAIESHLVLQHKMLAGRYAIVEGPSLCSTELTGGSVMLWMNGATLSLTSSQVSTSNLQNIMAIITSNGSLN